jgi:hypothetical protein
VQVSVCVAGYTLQAFHSYSTVLRVGLARYLNVSSASVFFRNVSTGCAVPGAPAAAPAGRRHLAQTPVPAPPPPDASCYNTTIGQPLPPGCVPAEYNVNNSVTGELDIKVSLSNSASVVAALDAIGNGTSGAAATLTAVLRTAGLSQIQGLRLPDLAAVEVLSRPPPPSPWPPHAPRPPPGPPGTADPDKSGRFSSRPPGAKKRVLDKGSSTGVAIAGVAALWFIVHAVIHSCTMAHQRRTCVTVALVVQCATGAQLYDDVANDDDDVQGAQHVSEPDTASLAMVGKRFKAPAAAAVLLAVLSAEAMEATAADALPPPQRVTLRPLQRGPLVSAAAVKSGHKAGALALRKKPTGVFWRLKRFVLSELHWQARELRSVGRFLRRCCGRSHDAVGKVFRLVPCRGAAVRDAAADASDPAHDLACQLTQRDDAAPSAVLFEATFSFGFAGRDAASAWRQCLRVAPQLEKLESALSAALSQAGGKTADPASSELTRVGAVFAALLDDEPHANLDKKRGAAAAHMQLDEVHAARSLGLAPPVAARRAALLLLSLRDTAQPAAVGIALAGAAV